MGKLVKTLIPFLKKLEGEDLSYYENLVDYDFLKVRGYATSYHQTVFGERFNKDKSIYYFGPMFLKSFIGPK